MLITSLEVGGCHYVFTRIGGWPLWGYGFHQQAGKHPGSNKKITMKKLLIALALAAVAIVGTIAFTHHNNAPAQVAAEPSGHDGDCMRGG